jgi:ribonuclease HI
VDVVAKRDWQKARERDAARRAFAGAKPRQGGSGKRQDALAAFVEKHGLRCFNCGAEKGEWAKTGVSRRGPWAICTTCVANGDETRSKTAVAPPPVTTEARAGATGPVVYTDGACFRNPGRGGYAAVIVGVLPREPLVVSDGERQTTNNRMEMRAVIEGLNALDPSPVVAVVTDSEYLIKGYTEWLPGWIRRGWRTSAKKPVKNADLWAEMVASAQRHGRVAWRWTRGHSGDRFNEMADEIAEKIAASE